MILVVNKDDKRHTKQNTASSRILAIFTASIER